MALPSELKRTMNTEQDFNPKLTFIAFLFEICD